MKLPPKVYARPGEGVVELCVMPEGWNHDPPVVVSLSKEEALMLAARILDLALSGIMGNVRG